MPTPLTYHKSPRRAIPARGRSRRVAREPHVAGVRWLYPNATRSRRAKKDAKTIGQHGGWPEWNHAVMERSNREPAVRIELTTARLRIGCSTTELRWRLFGRTRTCPGADSNRDAFRHHPLKMACLPISPPGPCDRGNREWGMGNRKSLETLCVASSWRVVTLP